MFFHVEGFTPRAGTSAEDGNASTEKLQLQVLIPQWDVSNYILETTGRNDGGNKQFGSRHSVCTQYHDEPPSANPNGSV
jgi:hypothetical protein